MKDLLQTLPKEDKSIHLYLSIHACLSAHMPMHTEVVTPQVNSPT